MYNLIEHSDNYSKTSGILWQYCRGRDEPLLADDGTIADNNDTTNVKITVPLKYLSTFWETYEMFFNKFEINVDLTWIKNCVIIADNADQDTIFSIPDGTFYVPLVTLSTQDNAKLLKQLKSGFRKTINWNKYQSKVLTERQDYLIEVFKE